jgi:hypothetical protein
MRPMHQLAATAALTVAAVVGVTATAGRPPTKPAAKARPAAARGSSTAEAAKVACTATKAVCDRAAQQADREGTPYHHPLGKGVALVTKDAAIAVAVREFPAPETAPRDAHLTTGAAFTRATGVVRTVGFDGSRPVWVVHVVAPVTTDSGPLGPGYDESEYSVVVDAATGGITDYCLGCDWSG